MTTLCDSWKGGRSVKMAFCLFLFMIPTALSAGIPPQNNEVQELLTRLNKPAVKSIQSPDGDIIDCVRIQDQLAFDHPLLKNHTIQATSEPPSKPNTVAQLWHLNGRCPEGTIPVRRVKEEDILRASSVESYGKKRYLNVSQLSSGKRDSVADAPHEYAYATTPSGKFFGGRAKYNVWQPQVGSESFSLAQMWIVSQHRETIEVGWQVYREEYGDDRPRFFIYWTSDGYQSTGCYNLECPGFVQLSNELTLGGAFYPVSTYNGTQYEIDVFVQKRADNGIWELRINEHLLGYWPPALYKLLAVSAENVRFGGEVMNVQINGQHTTTQMGSGHFPEEGSGKASYVRNMQTAIAPYVFESPAELQHIATVPNCYGLAYALDNNWGSFFFYGGPGRNPKCP